MAHGIRGSDGIAVINGGALNGLITDWEFSLKGHLLTRKGAGEKWQRRVWSYGDWSVVIEGHIPHKSQRHALTPGELHALRGAAIVVALKQRRQDSHPVFVARGLIEEYTQSKPMRGVVGFRAVVLCAYGEEPVINTVIF